MGCVEPRKSLTKHARRLGGCPCPLHSGQREQSSIFSEPEVVAQRVRKKLSREIQSVEIRVEIARHDHRPRTRQPTAGQNDVHDPADGPPVR